MQQVKFTTTKAQQFKRKRQGKGSQKSSQNPPDYACERKSELTQLRAFILLEQKWEAARRQKEKMPQKRWKEKEETLFLFLGDKCKWTWKRRAL
jgi:hypothetical protein